MARRYRQTQSTEKYLEAIFHFERQNGEVRVKDIAAELGFKKGTVSGALKKFKSHKLIVYSPYRLVKLTGRGRRIAEGIIRRNEILKQFLAGVLQMDPQEAETATRRMGYAVDDRIIERMMSFVADATTQGPVHSHQFRLIGQKQKQIGDIAVAKPAIEVKKGSKL